MSRARPRATYGDAPAWWHSEGYEGLEALRQAVTSTEMMLVEGV